MPGMPGMLGVGLNRSMHELNKESLEFKFVEHEKLLRLKYLVQKAELSGSKREKSVST